MEVITGSSPENESPMHHGTKRGPDSLFVDQDGELTDENVDSTHDSKRLRSDSEDILDMVARLNVNDESKVTPYDPATEGLPQLAGYHPKFLKTEVAVSQVAKQIIAAVERAAENGLRSNEIDTICELLKNDFASPQRHYPAIQHVALLGPPGIGKSSTTNSVLNQNAATETQDKERGTNLVHEYSALSLRQGAAKFQVAAPYLSAEQVSDFVKKHCDIIFWTIEQENDEEAGMDAIDLREYRSTSIDLLGILLCDKKTFENEKNIIEYFRSNVGKQKDIRCYVEQLILKLKSSRTLIDDVEYHIANDTRELAKVFRQVSRVPNTGVKRPHPWPIVQKVKIGMESQLLRAGAILGDAPGTGDANHAVVDATMNYIRTAGTIIIFDTPIRENKGSTIDDNLRLLVGLNKTDNILLVIPRIDILATLSDEQRDDLAVEDELLIQRAESATSALKDKHKNLKQQKGLLCNATLHPNTLAEVQQIDKELETLIIAIAFAESRKKQVIIEIHCRQRERDYQRKLHDIAKSRHVSEMEIFFISNQEYTKHRAGYDAKQPPILDVEGTGIPALRRRLFQVPVHGKAEALEFVCKKKLPDTLMSIKGVLTKSRLERKEEVASELTTQLRALSNVTKWFKDELALSFNEKVVGVMEDQTADWQDAANELVSQWGRYRAGTFSAFCRRGGQWRLPETKARINWNKLLQDLLTHNRELPTGFDCFVDGVETAVANLVTNTADAFNNVANHPDFKGVDGKYEFIKAVRSTRDRTVRDLAVLKNHMVLDFKKIRAATIHNPDESFIAQSMRKTYTDCAYSSIATVQFEAQKGKKAMGRIGVHAHRVKVVREKVTGTGTEQALYIEAKELAKEEFVNKSGYWGDEMVDVKLKEASEGLTAEFNRRFAMVDEEVKIENAEVAEQLKQAVDEGLELVNGEIAACVKAWMTLEGRKS